MATVISRVYSDLTHAVTLTTLGRSLTPGASYTHTPAGALTHGVSFTHRAVLLAPAVSSACGAPFTHGVPGSTHAGTLVTTPLAHGGSSILGVSSVAGVSSTHGLTLGVSLAHEDTLIHGVSRTQRLLLPVCVRRSTRFNTLVYTHRDTTHTGTTLATAHAGTLTLGTTLSTTHTGTLTRGTTLALASTRAPGVFTPPKLCVHPSAALTSTSRGTTESTWP